MADNRKLAQGLMMMTPAMREDLAGREQDIQRGKTVELLRRAGKEMYENPIVNTAIGFTPVLGDVQAAGETMSALNRGAPWQETAGYAAGMLPFVPMIGKTVWHGSPHTFDKFDLSKIGTGEGAQAYGHGLYLAENPAVAKEYQNMVRAEVNGKPFAPGPFDPEFGALNELHKSQNDYVAARKALEERAVRQGVDLSPEINALNDMEAQSVKANLGQLYKVDLPDEQIAKMLDWDKPLSEQSQNVRDAVGQLVGRNIDEETGWLKMRGEDALRAIDERIGMIERGHAEKALLGQGVPGIQYLDQASRGAGEGTRNYVVFSDEIPQILERNGQPIAQALRNYEAPQAKALREAEEYGQKMLGLPPGNTPMDRAIAGGYIDPSYHGTKTDVPEFDLSYHGTATDPGDFGEALYSSANPDIAGHYAESTMRGATTEGANIMPLLTRKGSQMQVEGMKGMEPLLEKAGGIENWFDMNPQQQAQIAKDMGYTSVRDFGYPQTANYDLGDVRSKFAAFDPRYFGKPGLMLGAGGLGVYGALQGEDEYQ